MIKAATNADRAVWSEHTIKSFADLVCGGRDKEDDQTILSDLLGDLMHWAERQTDVDFDDALEKGSGHYEYETTHCPECESHVDEDGYCPEVGCVRAGKTP